MIRSLPDRRPDVLYPLQKGELSTLLAGAPTMGLAVIRQSLAKAAELDKIPTGDPDVLLKAYLAYWRQKALWRSGSDEIPGQLFDRDENWLTHLGNNAVDEAFAYTMTRHAEPFLHEVREALQGHGNLRRALAPLMNPKKLGCLEPADVVLDIACGLWLDLLPAGDGRRYVFTPAQVVYKTLDYLNLGAEDHAVDIGCGPGRWPLLGKKERPHTRFSGIESNQVLASTGQGLAAAFCGFDGITIHCRDATTAPLDNFSVLNFYDPFTPPLAKIMAKRLEAEAQKRSIVLSLYAPDEIIPNLAPHIRASRYFEIDEEPLHDHIIIARSITSRG